MAEQLRPYQFRPGQSGNPSGRPKQPLPAAKLEVVTQELLTKTVDELKQIVDDPKTPSYKVLTAKAILRSTITGDYSHAKEVIDRAVGKVVERIEQDVSTTDLSLQLLSDVQLLQLAKEAVKVIESDARPALPTPSTEQ
jgi:hypothetical protein